MKLTVLMDNNTLIDRYFIAEPAVSYYIEEGSKAILFDVGYSDASLHNAERLGINLRKLDYIVLSHGHSDHTWGMDPLIRLYSEAKLECLDYQAPRLIAHPDVFKSKLLNGEEIGSMLSEDKVAKHFGINYSKEPIWLTDRLVYLGEIERNNSFEGQKPIGIVDDGGMLSDDYIADDTALVYKADDGLVIIVACSHSGICNIIEYARKICGDNRILDVIGGFHLQQPSEHQLTNTLHYFSQLEARNVYACHCTDLQSKIALASASRMKEVGVGLRIQY